MSLNSAMEPLMITLQHSTSLWWSVNRFIQPAIHQRSFFNFVFVNLRVFHKKGAAYSLRYAPLWFKVVFNRLISKYKSELFVTKTSRELLFDGYEDPLLDLAKHFPSGKFPPFDKFAWFYQVNSAFTVYAQILTNNEFMANCSVTIPIITTACSTSSLVLMTSTSWPQWTCGITHGKHRKQLRTFYPKTWGCIIPVIHAGIMNPTAEWSMDLSVRAGLLDVSRRAFPCTSPTFAGNSFTNLGI